MCISIKNGNSHAVRVYDLDLKEQICLLERGLAIIQSFMVSHVLKRKIEQFVCARCRNPGDSSNLVRPIHDIDTIIYQISVHLLLSLRWGYEWNNKTNKVGPFSRINVTRDNSSRVTRDRLRLRNRIRAIASREYPKSVTMLSFAGRDALINSSCRHRPRRDDEEGSDHNNLPWMWHRMRLMLWTGSLAAPRRLPRKFPAMGYTNGLCIPSSQRHNYMNSVHMMGPPGLELSIYRQ